MKLYLNIKLIIYQLFITMSIRKRATRSLKVNDIVYVSGDYFDEDEDNRWSEKVAKINYKKQSLLGLVKSFVRKYDEQYVNVLWFADFSDQAVLLKDVKRIPIFSNFVMFN